VRYSTLGVRCRVGENGPVEGWNGRDAEWNGRIEEWNGRVEKWNGRDEVPGCMNGLYVLDMEW
jgi:hypothetical protein